MLNSVVRVSDLLPLVCDFCLFCFVGIGFLLCGYCSGC